MPIWKGKFTDKELSIILIFGILGFVIIVGGTYIYDYYEITPNFWSPMNPIVKYPYRFWAPIVIGIGVFFMFLGFPISSIYWKRGEESSSVRFCLGCGYELSKNVKFCPRCGKTVEKITVQQ